MAGLTPPLSFFKSQWKFLLFGFLLAFFSSPGQTFFISLFSGQIRSELNLSHGDFGTLYAIGTLASAATLIPLGRLVDTIKLRVIAVAIICGLAIAAFHFSYIHSAITLAFGVYLLRLTGQGMMSHLYSTAITRRYVAERGRAFSIAVFGHPVSEFAMPVIIIALLAMMDWRQVWQVTAVAVLVIMIPATFFLTGRIKGQDGGGVESLDAGSVGRGGVHWTRKEMLTHPRFWLLSGLIIAPSFTTTGLFFHQIYFTEVKGILLSDWVKGFGFYATLSIFGSFLGGYLVDRFTSVRIAPLAVGAISLAGIMLYFIEPGGMVYGYFIVLGLVQGLAHTAATPIWAELYGTKHLGGIKAIAQSMMVFASALSPVTLGIMIDYNMSLFSLISVLVLVPFISGILAYLGTK